MARPIAEDLGNALRKAYTEAGLTQVQLAELLQERGWATVTQARVSSWARGMYAAPLDILPDVDDACGQPRGYVLELAGYVDADALVARRRDASAPLTSQRRPRRPEARARKPAAG